MHPQTPFLSYIQFETLNVFFPICHSTPKKVLRDIEQRDKNDRERDVAPAVAAADATVLDNSLLDLAGTVDAALTIIEQKLALCERA